MHLCWFSISFRIGYTWFHWPQIGWKMMMIEAAVQLSERWLNAPYIWRQKEKSASAPFQFHTLNTIYQISLYTHFNERQPNRMSNIHFILLNIEFFFTSIAHCFWLAFRFVLICLDWIGERLYAILYTGVYECIKHESVQLYMWMKCRVSRAFKARSINVFGYFRVCCSTDAE